MRWTYDLLGDPTFDSVRCVADELDPAEDLRTRKSGCSSPFPCLFDAGWAGIWMLMLKIDLDPRIDLTDNFKRDVIAAQRSP